MAVARPDPLHWLWYACGGRLPGRYREWVRHDLTVPTWRWRYAGKILVRAVPFLVAGFVVLNLLPGVPAWLAMAAMGFALLYTFYFTLTSSDEFRKVRLVQHGFPASAASAAQGSPESGRRPGGPGRPG
ncbi:MAG TPA: DUF5313 family protein [Actinophytocola sp.]|uniref:DUF5313 family protein n=1 Tax=Actinophytocola sp. TaxID=1872138 RepID=UPI002DDD5793|nr:DUF5313 family protein [Actinophytocola sp.]HEV2782766.1 DUF5313 family protein [Actinophytocola sp.]